MKVTVLPLVAAALGFAAQVSAGPIRIYVLAPENGDLARPESTVSHAVDAPVAHMRWGLAAAGAPASVTQPWSKTIEDNDSKPVRKHGCGGGMRMKAIMFSNWIREKVGLEPIAPPPHHLHFPHGRPLPHRPEDAKVVLTSSSLHHPGENGTVDGHPHFRHSDYNHRHRPSTFIGRLQRALMTLGPWEGRIAAFIFGCGIGSFLMMFYVLCVVGYRSFVARRNKEKVEVIFAEVEEVESPKYIADEKVPIE
ncbi:hypothetical protein ACEPAH_6901 [Sanghuangporus vaninii]